MTVLSIVKRLEEKNSDQNEDKDDSCRSVTETSMIFIIPIPPMAGTFGEEVLKLSRAPVCLPSSQRPSGTVGVT
jgi:hypothetical protein